MPKAIGPDGVEREVSMEEFLEAMQNGNVSVQQNVHHADGSVTSSVVYGNDIGDGVDRSVNLFGSMNDVLSVAIFKARKIKEADENAEKIFFMDNSDADYEVTVDDTEQPVMHIITCTKEKVSVKRYVRDEMKAVGESIADGEYEFVDGTLSATIEDIQADSLFLFAFSVYEIRKLLEERGLLQTLQEIGNRGSGVIVTKNDEEIGTKIVRGAGRPDLPCLLFGGMFSNEPEMMRPYPDEFMGMDSYEDMSLDEKIEAAEDGDETLMEELANLYLNGDEDEDVAPDAEKAVYWFTKLAERDDCDNSNVQFNLGLLFAKGHGTERNFAKAAYWMRRAEENGDTDAPALIEEYEKMIVAVDKAAAGDAQAQADLAAGLMRMAGSLDQAGPGNDYEEAFALAQKSAEQNNGDGLWTLALAYEHGRGVRKNTKKAVECYRKGAELGHAPSQHSLACYYLRGEVVEQDETLAVELMMKSAEQCYNLAEFGLAHAYERGIGVEDDLDKAIEWGEKAAEHGTPDIWYEVAKLYMNETGEGMIDAERARHWLSKAADAGNEMAFGMLNFAPIWGEDGDDDDMDSDEGDNLPDGFMAALEAFEEAEEYENELADAGVIPDAPRPEDGVMSLSAEDFPRIALKAEEGDERALEILAKMKAANELG